MIRNIFATALFFLPCQAFAASVDTSKFVVLVTSLEPQTVGARMVFSLKSSADQTATIFVDCAAIGQSGAPIDVTTVAVYNVRPGQTAYSKADTNTDFARVKSAVCRVSTADAN